MKKQSQEDFIDIKELARKLFSKWHYFAISLIIFLAIGVLMIKKSPSIYAVNSVLKMNVGATKAEVILDAKRVQQDRNNAKNVEDEILVVKSSEYVGEALNNLDFVVSYFAKDFLKKTEKHKMNFPFSVNIDSSALQITNVPIEVKILNDKEYELKIEAREAFLYNFQDNVYLNDPVSNINVQRRYKFGQPVKEDFYGFTVNLVRDPRMYGDNELSFVINNPESLTKQYLSKLNIEQAARDSRILLLTTQGSIIQKETEFLNSLMEVVRQKNLDEKNQEGIATINFIDYQLEDVSQSLNKAEQDLESFSYSTTRLGETSTLYARRDQLESEVADLNLRMNYLRNLLSNLESVDGVSRISGPGSVGIEDPILSSLLQKLTDLHQQRIQLGRTATEANPVVQRIDLEIRSTKDAIRDKISGAINTTTIMINDANSRMMQTNEMINRLPSTEVRRLGVQRKLNFSDNTYDLFLERKAAAAIALATNVSDWAIVERARLEGSGPVSPKKAFIYLLSFFLALIVPTAVILTVDYFNNNIKDKNDLEKITNIPLLGTITKGNKYVKLASDYDTRSPLLESLRSVRLNLQFFLPMQNHQIIGITSSTSGEGKTFTSVNLGVVLAQSGKKVLVLDADMRKSNMSKYFSLESGKGLSTYLIGSSTVGEVVQKSKLENLDVIFSGPFPPNPFELLSLNKLGDLLNEMKLRYDYIIIDTPPLGIVSDYLLFLQYVDASVYVTRYNYTNKKFLEKINDLYDNKKIQNLGIILNDVKSSALYGGIYNSMKDNGYYAKQEVFPKKKVPKLKGEKV